MESWTISQIIVAFLLAGAVAWSINCYNRLIEYQNRFMNAFAQIDVQLTRRYDLIPNLVETAKAYMKHERETLERVISARNQAASAAHQAADHPEDPGAIKKLMGAEGALSGAMGKFFALMENYPDLKANQNMMQLSEELTSTENRVAFARQAFNDSIMAYNTAREVFPDNLIANVFRFQPGQLLEIENVQKRDVPQVTFA